MTVKELYDVLGEDYEEIFERIGADTYIVKYLKKFAAENYLEELCSAFESKNWEEAFKASHSLKGMGLNLGLARLANASSVLCETVRNGAPAVDTEPLIAEVRKEYEFAVSNINKFE